ncbi:hypothetical protein [Neisseria sicca]|uniref:hypothetical protein n=1 Tax=Neisseria sicca TaxID=490 RepID=UPI001649B705|nr:hypothetical protein [Neisseria sicca]
MKLSAPLWKWRQKSAKNSVKQDGMPLKRSSETRFRFRRPCYSNPVIRIFRNG